MKYKIGEVAKLLGITAEAIRYYEEQGIISPTKDENSGYRYYDVWDIHMLIRTRAYRQFYYSLAEANTLINESSVDDIITSLTNKEADIQSAITWNLNLLKQIRSSKDRITQAAADVGQHRLEQRPAMYRLHLQEGYNLLEDSHKRSLYHAWIEKVPFVFPSAFFQKDAFENGDLSFSYGYAVDEEYAEFLNITASADVDFLPSLLCLYTTILTTSDTVLSPLSLAPTIAFMHSQGLRLCGNVVSRVVLMNKLDNKYCAWNQIWLPVE